MKYRKKPVVIEAVRWRGYSNRLGITSEPPDQPIEVTMDNMGAIKWEALPSWLPQVSHVVSTDALVRPEPPAPGEIWRDRENLWIGTLEGTMICSPGDWIIKGVKGELYPCKPDIFAATYDPVTCRGPSMKIIVCGGRDFVDVPLLWRELDDLAKNTPEPGIRLVVDGASDDVTGPYKGADYWAHQWALARNIPTVREHANWDQQGKAAGPIRNGEMLKRHHPDRVVVFPGGRGTSNMVEQAERACVVVQTIRSEGLQRFAKSCDQ